MPEMPENKNEVPGPQWHPDAGRNIYYPGLLLRIALGLTGSAARKFFPLLLRALREKRRPYELPEHGDNIYDRLSNN